MEESEASTFPNFYNEDVSSRFLQVTDTYVPDYRIPHPRCH